MGEGIDRQGLRGIIGEVGSRVGGQNVVRRDRLGQAERNSSLVGRLSSNVNKVLSLHARDPGSRARGGSSLSLSEGKKSDEGWFLKVLGRELGYGGSHQLVLFKVEMVAVYKNTMPVDKLDLLLCLVLGKRQA